MDTNSASQQPGRVTLPLPPQPPGRTDFPLIASIAPVLGSLVMWAVTQSPFALVFAFLGPVVAIASLVDSRLHGRKSLRAERTRFLREVQSAKSAIESEHSRERLALVRTAREPAQLIAGMARDPEWWRDSIDGWLPVCLGRGTIRSSLSLDGGQNENGEYDPAVDGPLSALRQAAAELSEAPVIIDARHGIGICGPPVAAAALARAISVQLVSRLSPGTVAVQATQDAAFGYLAHAPHAAIPPQKTQAAGLSQAKFLLVAAATDDRTPAPGVLCVVARHEHELPRECRVVVRIDRGGTARVTRHPEGAEPRDLRPHFVTAGEAIAFAGRASRNAIADGLSRAAGVLPGLLTLSELVQQPSPLAGTLTATIGRGAEGPVAVDLVADGPHAIVGGTTGSGKSELLISWVLAMAESASPAEVNFLLVDFKGGASFAAVQHLPHTVGLITDLDEAGATRALTSLRAELRHRERALADAGARSIEELPAESSLPRLVIVVDEFAVVVGEFPELHMLFADLAARGRSLGVHLVLCTQRPGGVVRDSVLANCTLRLSLRVNNQADSIAVIGTGAAGRLPKHPFGRCYVGVAGSDPQQFQVAIAEESDIARIRQRWSGATWELRRPWCDPLPARVLPELLGPVAGALAFGLIDLPEAQSQPTALYDPARDGNLVVVGGHGTGKSGALGALAAAEQGSGYRVSVLPSDIEGSWDAVTAVLGRAERESPVPTVYLLDNVDVLLGRFPEQHQHAFGELLLRLLREGPGSGSHLVMTSSRPTSAVQSLVAACDSRLLLRLPNRQEHALAGGDSATYTAELSPGGGHWQGHRVQIAVAADLIEPARPRTLFEHPAYSLVTNRPRHAIEQLNAVTVPGTVFDLAAHAASAGAVSVSGASSCSITVADPATWQAQWGTFAAARASGPILFDGCTVAEFRALTGSRTLPPPIRPGSSAVWVLSPDGSTTRAHLPALTLDAV